MIYIHSMARAIRYYPERPALSLEQSTLTFSQLHNRVRRLAAGLSRAGFKKGDRLAILLSNAPEYIELVYACSWLGVIAVPINVRLSIPEIDHVLTDCGPRGIVRSEEHTSELQSHVILVCRLLLEKKKQTSKPIPSRTNKNKKQTQTKKKH